MGYSVHGSGGTPDMAVTTEAVLAYRIPGYPADEDDLADSSPRLWLADHGNQIGWVFQLPGGSEDLFAMAREIEALGHELERTERAGTHAGWCACGRELIYNEDGTDWLHADDHTPTREAH